MTTANPGYIGLPTFDLIVASWREDAACLGSDPDLFFPEQGGGMTEKERRNVRRRQRRQS